MHDVVSYGILMVRLFPLSTESIRERKLVGTGVVLLHILLIWLLLHGATKGDSGADNVAQGDGEGLLVEFITVPRAPSQPQAHTLAPLALSISPAIGPAQERETLTHIEEAERTKVLSKSGDYASLAPALKSQPNEPAARAAADTSTFSSPEGGNPSDDLLSSYHAALRSAIQKQWAEQTERSFPSGCVIRLIQSVGGALNASSAVNCDLSRQERLQLEAAALMAQPLPYVGYEAVFLEDMSLQL